MEPDPSKISRCAIGVLAKAPIPGRVKTRLHSIWSPEDCARFQDACLRDTLAAARRLSAYPPLLSIDPLEEGLRFERSLPFGVSVRAQSSGDLGARIAYAFELLFEEPEATRALLAGSDSPDMPATIWLE